jgi:hypothetical protein
LPKTFDDRNMCRCIRIGVYVNTYEFEAILNSAGKSNSLSDYLRRIIIETIEKAEEPECTTHQ